MENDDIEFLVNSLGKSTAEENKAMHELRKKVGVRFPEIILQKYKVSRKADVRERCLNVCIPYSRDFPAAVELGILALEDRAKDVRTTACILLACSLNDKTIPDLKKAYEKSKDDETKENILAAIDAIESKNHNFFFDREHAGNFKYKVSFRHPDYG